MESPTRVGVIGCGAISGVYIETMKRLKDLEIVACADISPEAVEFRANQYDIPKRYTPEALLADPDVELVLNLTSPNAHAPVATQILEAGKHVYGEKPLATTREAARKVLDLAAERGLRVGCAPDTFFGGAIQTCQKLIEEGTIGKPVAALAVLAMYQGSTPRRRRWKEDEMPPFARALQSVSSKAPGFYFTKGVGPMYDMGPYYLTTLAVLMGPIRRVTGSAHITWPERPYDDPKFKVETPTHVASVLDHASGAVTTLITSSDIWAAGHPNIEIYGEKATLRVPDPNFLGGTVQMRPVGEEEWIDVPLTHGYAGDWWTGWHFTRGLGVADMARSIRLGRPHRASGDLAYHVLDVVEGVHEASREGRHVEITSEFVQPKVLPVGLAEGELD